MQDEGLQDFFPTLNSTPQFLTRFVSHICAPAFLFIAGLMLSLSLENRLERGQSRKALTIHFILRGLSLMAIDFLIINRIGMTFGILACIGTCMILLILIQSSSNSLILLFSLGLLVFHPWINFSWLLDLYPQSAYLIHVLSEPIRQKSWSVFYPVIPWIGVMGIGFYLGSLILRNLTRRRNVSRYLILGGLSILLVFIPVRFTFGAICGDSSLFWLMSKYPPSLSFILWNLGMTFALIGGFFRWEEKKDNNSRFLKVLAVYGRVPLFFYVVHRYLYGIIPTLTHTRGEYALITTYIVWLMGLVPLYFLCQSYEQFRRFGLRAK
jgi:uncharacterized membrane protein